MGRLNKFYLVLALVAVAFVACDKRVTEVDSAFVGDWQSEVYPDGTHYELTITEDGRGTYALWEGEQRKEYASGVARIDGDVIKIDRTRLQIDQFPVESDEEVNTPSGKRQYNWSMKVQRWKLFR